MDTEKFEVNGHTWKYGYHYSKGDNFYGDQFSTLVYNPFKKGANLNRKNLSQEGANSFLSSIVVGRLVKGYLANSADPDQMPQNAASD